MICTINNDPIALRCLPCWFRYAIKTIDDHIRVSTRGTHCSRGQGIDEFRGRYQVLS